MPSEIGRSGSSRQELLRKQRGGWKGNATTMCLTRLLVLFFSLIVFGAEVAGAQQAPVPAPDSSPETTAQLLEQLKAQDARLKELEAQVSKLKAAHPATPGETPVATPPAAETAPAATAPADAAPVAAAAPVPEEAPVAQTDTNMGGHSMSIPGGPVINVQRVLRLQLRRRVDRQSLGLPDCRRWMRNVRESGHASPYHLSGWRV